VVICGQVTYIQVCMLPHFDCVVQPELWVVGLRMGVDGGAAARHERPFGVLHLGADEEESAEETEIRLDPEVAFAEGKEMGENADCVGTEMVEAKVEVGEEGEEEGAGREGQATRKVSRGRRRTCRLAGAVKSRRSAQGAPRPRQRLAVGGNAGTSRSAPP
jgi:hypothetical protein